MANESRACLAYLLPAAAADLVGAFDHDTTPGNGLRASKSADRRLMIRGSPLRLQGSRSDIETSDFPEIRDTP